MRTMNKRIRSIRADPAFIDMVDQMKKEMVINLNVPLSNANITRIITHRLQNDGKKIVVKKRKNAAVVEFL